MVDLEIKLDMKDSGSPDLKALRKAHMFPMNGHPKSPGGSQNFLSPSFLSYRKQFTPRRVHKTEPANPLRTVKISAKVLESIDVKEFLSVSLSLSLLSSWVWVCGLVERQRTDASRNRASVWRKSL